MKAYKALQGKKPTASYRSGSCRFPSGPPTVPADYNPKGMGEVNRAKSGAAWARAPADVRPYPKDPTGSVPFYETRPLTPAGTKVVSAAMRSTSARLDSPRRPDIPFGEYKGMGTVVKKKSSGTFSSHAPRLPEDKSQATVYYDKKGGVGDVTKAPKASSWARSNTTRPVYKSKTPDFLNPVDPSLKSNRSAKSAFATQSERLPSYGSIVPGPGAYASPYVGAGMAM